MSGLQFTWLKKGPRDQSASPLLQIENLSVRVGIRQVLSDISLKVYAGDHIRITGPNGCGKSTLLNAIAGVDPARVKHGEITFAGRNISKLPAHERSACGIAYMRQSDNVFPGLSVAENLKLALGDDGPERFQAAYPDWADALPLNNPAGHLSGGQRKKIAWGMTVLKHAVLFLTDEAEAGVSEHLVASDNSTIITVFHD